MYSLRLAVGALALLLSFSIPVVSQTTATLHGQVSDPSGAAVSGAAVEAENTATGLVRKAVTNAEGIYLIPALPPGSYKVAVSSSGFKGFLQSGITLRVSENVRVDASLSLGSVSEQVTVEADAVVVDTRSTTVGTTVDNRRIENLPLNGRNVLALAQLLPGVGTANVQITNANARTGPTITVSGSRVGGNNIMLDGASLVQLMYNRGINLPNPDALQEFRVLTNTYSAEYGRGYGGVFLGVTKSGTNEVHGSLFEFFRHDDLNARNRFAAGKPKLRQNQFGGSLGGPVLLPGYDGRNRTFIFGSYQGVRIRKETLDTFFPPTAAELAGDFSASSRPILDPLTRQQFPGNRIPSSRIDPGGINFVREYVPLPNRPDGRAVIVRPGPTEGNQFIVKGDHQVNANHRLTLRYYRNRDAEDNQGGQNLVRLGAKRASIITVASLAQTYIFSPRTLNEFGLSFFRIDNRWVPSPLNRAPRDLGINVAVDGPNILAPRMSVGGRFVGAPLIGFAEPEQTWQFSDKLSWIRGRHSIKAGAEIRNLVHVTRAQFTSGGFTFDGTHTGNSMADFILGRPISFSQLSPIEDVSESEHYHLFVQDDVQLSPRLTLNLGLRYEVSTPWEQVHGKGSTFRAGQQSRRFPGAPLGLVYPGDPGVPGGIIPADKNNFLPRIGFAWDPTGNGRTSIRGAYGLFSAPAAAIISAFGNETPPYTLTLSFRNPHSTSDPYRGRQNPFPYVFQENPVFPDFPLEVSTLDPGFRDGYIQQFNLNVQRQLGNDLVLQVGYVGQLGRKLSAVRDINYARFRPGATADDIDDRRPFPAFAGIVNSTSDTNSNYNSLQVSINKRFAQNYTLQLAYTYGKSIDQRSGTTADDGGGVQDPDNYHRGEQGLSDFQQKHILALNGIWDLPFFRNRGLLSQVLYGWQLAGTLRVASGLPFNVVSGRDVALTGTGSQRPDVVGIGPLDPGRPRSEVIRRYFNTAAFALPPAGRFGNSGRNSLVGPGFSQADLSVTRRFQLPAERLGRIEFRCEVFNLLNHTNFNNPQANFSSPGFGTLLAAQDARIVQLALRYSF